MKYENTRSALYAVVATHENVPGESIIVNVVLDVFGNFVQIQFVEQLFSVGSF